MTTLYKGKYIAASAGTAVSTVPGYLFALVASHGAAATRTLTLYNAAAATPGTEIFCLKLPPDPDPVYLRFPRDEAIHWTSKLYVVNTNIELQLWYIEA